MFGEGEFFQGVYKGKKIKIKIEKMNDALLFKVKKYFEENAEGLYRLHMQEIASATTSGMAEYYAQNDLEMLSRKNPINWLKKENATYRAICKEIEKRTINFVEREIKMYNNKTTDVYWVTAQGERKKVSEMDNNHLLNTKRFLERNAEKIFEEKMSELASAISFLSGDMATYHAERNFDALSRMNPQQWLTQEHDVYKAICDEIEKRELLE